MTVQEIIRKYGLTLLDNEHVRAERSKVKSQSDVDCIKNNKPEILAFLIAEKEAKERAAAERQAKIDGIEGLRELYATINAWERNYAAFERAWERGDGVLPSSPKVSVDEVKARYPRAAAYVLATEYECSSNYEKAAAGRKAKERIINGEDFETVIADMKAEWEKAAMSHMWD